MPRSFHSRSGLTRDTLLRLAALGVLTIAAGTSPYFLSKLAQTYFQDKIRETIRARAKKLRELERRQLVNFQELADGKIRIELTHHGKKLIRLYNLDEMKLTRPKRWDGRWRIVVYDIPTGQKRASNAFREKLKQLGLYPLQRSVWISPFECLPELEFLATVFEIDIDSCLCYLMATQVPREKELRRFFGL
ncbi:MAG: CRISPR-associated endonuclease Cas2 [Candidatus Liptonbacteria bacterium]|nr:CRISPR-associated endonuclease Cas2 [Candidatus Liptonbacteria bacterium]